ncbi:MAG: long-chain fatty acid--CoA ligase, partial [bacterium]|nr:long-chain fatty acid--CoA ligase [bacterium]
LYKFLCQIRKTPLEQSSLRLALSAGEALPGELNHQFEKIFGTPVSQIYGATEIPSSTVNARIKENRNFLSVGEALPGVDIKIAGNPPNQPGSGEIYIKSLFGARKYFKEPDQTANAFDQGWFNTGDLGTLDKNKHLSIQGRKKNILNISGNKVSPEEVEEVLLAMPGVRDVAVFGRMEKNHGEIVAAKLVPEAGDTLKEYDILRYLKTRIAPYKIPKKITFCDEITRKSNTTQPKKHKRHNML